MQPQQNVSLSEHSAMGLGGTAAYYTEVHSRMDVEAAWKWATEQQLPVIMIGGGNNIVWRDEGFNGLLIVNMIERYETYEEDETNVYVTIGGGEDWDAVVRRTVDAGLTGIEALSLIPGKSGAVPVQNVGAYGQDISQVLATVEVFDTKTASFSTIPGGDCGFGYRMSRFNTVDKGRYFITGLTLHLTKGNPTPPFYDALGTYFAANKITTYTPQIVRDAVIALRSFKLPDVHSVKNVGSFFANPIISEEMLTYISANYLDVPSWSVGAGSVKIPAAWLIERAGFKDYHDEATGMATWAKQPLVFVNEHASSTADLLAFKQKIVTAVHERFNITLVQEPELLPVA